MAENNVKNETVKTEENFNDLVRVRREKLKTLQDAGQDPFTITKFDVTHHSEEIKANYDALEGQEVSIAGRMMSKRIMGKASFCHVQDLQGTIQCYVARDSLGEEEYAAFKKDKENFKSKLGENATAVVLLTGSGFKDMKAFDGRVSLPDAIENSEEEVAKLPF
jgi:lysyl-tRNA synthetase class 2